MSIRLYRRRLARSDARQTAKEIIRIEPDPCVAMPCMHCPPRFSSTALVCLLHRKPQPSHLHQRRFNGRRHALSTSFIFTSSTPHPSSSKSLKGIRSVTSVAIPSLKSKRRSNSAMRAMSAESHTMENGSRRKRWKLVALSLESDPRELVDDGRSDDLAPLLLAASRLCIVCVVFGLVDGAAIEVQRVRERVGVARVWLLE